MTNIYDVINELYNDDEGWNTVLDRKYAEQFLRTEAFHGASDDELLEIWQQVMYLLIYCGNTSYRIGDMTGEDLIYCISWCQRNIGDFELDYGNVDYFLSVVQRLLTFLKQKKAISGDTAAAKCRLKLLGADGRLLLFQNDGSLPEEYENFRTNREPDLETKVFMQLGQKLAVLFDMMQNYFGDARFSLDRRRACYAFFGSDKEPETDMERPELFASFWEYFIFDYRLRDTDERPIDHFYTYYKNHPDSQYGKSNKALTELLASMQKIQLMVFTIEREEADGWFSCRDFFSGSISELSLPVDETVDIRNFLCIAHVFEDGNLITEYLRNVIVAPPVQKVLYNRLSGFLAYYRVAHPDADWEQFVNANPALVMHMVAYAGIPDAVIQLTHLSEKVREYIPAVIRKDDPVHQFLSQFGKLLHLSWQDRKNLTQMWGDFYSLRPIACFRDEDYMIWALAVLENYMKITKTFLMDVVPYAEKVHIDTETIAERTAVIKDVLQLEPFDPRYISEDAFMNMVFS
ncbi:MAG: hypothetical protein IJG43_04800 [Acidaminococcaceae bacterium]|nr:hypothetical protein [Acidaminococcaceae bacterium]